jgi:hypothetical protein
MQFQGYLDTFFFTTHEFYLLIGTVLAFLWNLQSIFPRNQNAVNEQLPWEQYQEIVILTLVDLCNNAKIDIIKGNVRSFLVP